MFETLSMVLIMLAGGGKQVDGQTISIRVPEQTRPHTSFSSIGNIKYYSDHALFFVSMGVFLLREAAKAYEVKHPLLFW